MDEGYRERPEAARLPPVTKEVIAAASMEMIAFRARKGCPEEIVELMPTLVYVILAPFTGVPAAREFVERAVRSHRGAS